MNLLLATQHMEEYNNKADAYEALYCLLNMDGTIAGRILHPSDIYPKWRIQVFSEKTPLTNEELPDGMRNVTVPSTILKQCIKKQNKGE